MERRDRAFYRPSISRARATFVGPFGGPSAHRRVLAAAAVQVDVVERRDDLSYRAVGERVVDRLRFAARRHDAFRAKLGEVLRERGLAELDALVDLAYRELFVEQETQHAQALVVRERLQE